MQFKPGLCSLQETAFVPLALVNVKYRTTKESTLILILVSVKVHSFTCRFKGSKCNIYKDL